MGICTVNYQKHIDNVCQYHHVCVMFNAIELLVCLVHIDDACQY